MRYLGIETEHQPEPFLERVGLTLAERAYAILTDKIVSLEIPPKSAVSEASLSKGLGIGRTPIREAVKRLERDHLIEFGAGRGIIVREISVRDMLLMLELRRALEPLRYVRATQRASEDDRQSLVELASQLKEAAARRDVRVHTMIDRKFDDLVDRCAANPFLTDALTPLHSNVRRFWNAQVKNGGFDEAARLHFHLVEAVATGNTRTVVDTCGRMLDFNAEFFTKLHIQDI